MSEFDARSAPFVQVAEQEKQAGALIKSKKTDDIIMVLNFDTVERAQAFSSCIAKCEKYGLTKRRERYMFEAKTMTAVKGAQAKLFSQTIIGVPVPNFYAEGSENKGKIHGGQQQNS